MTASFGCERSIEVSPPVLRFRRTIGCSLPKYFLWAVILIIGFSVRRPSFQGCSAQSHKVDLSSHLGLAPVQPSIQDKAIARIASIRASRTASAMRSGLPAAIIVVATAPASTDCMAASAANASMRG